MDRATKHAEEVVNNHYGHGKLHIKACQRHLNDLKRQGTDEFPYLWDSRKSQRVIDFGETLTIAEGTEKMPVHLYDFQCFDMGSLFGWVHKDTGFRRFRTSYITMARQNGKSFLNGMLGTYICGFSNYRHGRLFTAATKRRQSRLVWDEMRKFIQADQQLNELFKVQEWKNTITSTITHCTIEALSKEGGLDEGFRSIFSSIDELHQMKDNAIYSSLSKGTIRLDETLISMISSRGRDLNTFAYEMDTYAKNILNRAFEAEQFFVDMYAIDDDDDYFSEESIMKANPLLQHIPSGWDSLLNEAQRAKDMGGQQLSEYITKNLNYWYRDANSDFIEINAWNDCAGKLDITGRECYVGLDLSRGGDLTSIGFNFETDDGRDFFTSHSFMPRGRYFEHLKSDLAPYDVWVKSGLLTLTGGEGDFQTDYLYILDYLKSMIETYDIKVLGIGYDNHNISALLQFLDDFGVPLMDIRQSARNLNDATTNIRLNVMSKRLVHDKTDQILSWGMANARIVSNSFGEIKIDKYDTSKTRRIDPVDAIIDAHAMKLKQKPETDINEAILSEDWTL